MSDIDPHDAAHRERFYEAVAMMTPKFLGQYRYCSPTTISLNGYYNAEELRRLLDLLQATSDAALTKKPRPKRKLQRDAITKANVQNAAGGPDRPLYYKHDLRPPKGQKLHASYSVTLIEATQTGGCCYCNREWERGHQFHLVEQRPDLTVCPGECTTRVLQHLRMYCSPPIATKGGSAGAMGGSNGRVIRDAKGLS